ESANWHSQCVLARIRGCSSPVPCELKAWSFTLVEFSKCCRPARLNCSDPRLGTCGGIRASPMQIRNPGRFKLKWHQLSNRRRGLRWMSLTKTSTFVMRLQPGVKMRLYADSELCRLIYCCNFEETERAFLNRFLRPGDIFIDVGANIGLYTLIAAARVGPSGRVVALEPTTTTFARLMDNVQLNKFSNVNCVNLALSDWSGHLDLTRSK